MQIRVNLWFLSPASVSDEIFQTPSQQMGPSLNTLEHLASSWKEDISPRLAALRWGVQVAADTVAEMAVAQSALRSQRLQLQTWHAECHVMITYSLHSSALSRGQIECHLNHSCASPKLEFSLWRGHSVSSTHSLFRYLVYESRSWWICTEERRIRWGIILFQD